MFTLIRVPVIFRKVDALALIDTGAAVSVISLIIFQELASKGKVKLYNNNALVFKSATGNELMVTGYFKLTFQLGGVTFQHPFYVIKNLNEECIIGMDFLEKTVFAVHGPERILHIETEGKHLELPFDKILTRVEVNSITSMSLPSLENFSRADRNRLHELLQRNADCFATKIIELGQTNVIKYTIEIKGPPVSSPPYRSPPAHKEVVAKHVQELLESGIISPSQSPYSSPILVVGKPDGGLRMVVDYRRVNKQIVKDKYPLPRIDDTIDALYGAKYFTTLDLFSGFYQIPLDEKSKEITAFITHEGLYEFNRLPMGLANSPSVFQRALNSILKKFITIKICLVYIDDIVIFSRTFEEHI
jgi:Reverse transcriptase (RNA-dependent DNA polymerase)/gag-polyprotein putative aspartyl protease